MTLQMELRWQYDGNTMAQASTLVPVTKMKKHKRGRLRYREGSPKGAFFPINLMSSDVNVKHLEKSILS